jgi:hypothetical protein
MQALHIFNHKSYYCMHQSAHKGLRTKGTGSIKLIKDIRIIRITSVVRVIRVIRENEKTRITSGY